MTQSEKIKQAIAAKQQGGQQKGQPNDQQGGQRSDQQQEPQQREQQKQAAPPAQQQNKQPAKQTKGSSLTNLIERMRPNFKDVLQGIGLSEDRFVRILTTAVNNNPDLIKTTEKSFFAAAMQSAMLGLEPNTNLGLSYIIPYGSQAQFQLGYQGILNLAYRSEKYKMIYCEAIYPNDHYEFEYGLNKNIKHIPNPEPEGTPEYYYGIYHLTNGGYDLKVMSRQQVVDHARKYSKSYKRQDSAWRTSFDVMAKKTVLIQLLKYAPKSVEMQQAMASDESVKVIEDGQIIDVEVQQDEPIY